MSSFACGERISQVDRENLAGVNRNCENQYLVQLYDTYVKQMNSYYYKRNMSIKISLTFYNFAIS